MVINRAITWAVTSAGWSTGVPTVVSNPNAAANSAGAAAAVPVYPRAWAGSAADTKASGLSTHNAVRITPPAMPTVR